VAVVCATVALVPQSASAAAWAPLATGLDVPGSTTAYNACPNTSAPAAGFTDTTSTSVDCVKMFGITQGTTATTYSPADPVTRWQMALFLNRMYGPTGLTAGTGTFTAFTDIGGLSSEIQTAINGIAASGVTVGTATGVYSPDQNVTRAEMAIFLMRMADLLKDNDADNNGTQTALSTVGTVANGGYNYTDIANQSHEGLRSIVRSYDMGVAEDACTAGLCDSTYRPGDDITRIEMAEMMHRLLNHTNARPAGVSIQSPTTAAAAATMVTQISVRGADFSVSHNVSVGVMRHIDTVASALDDTAYNPLTGLCIEAIVVGTGSPECSIDAGDAVTLLTGNVAGPSATHAANQTITWTAHTGASGSAYVDGTTVANKEVSTLGAAAEYVSATTATLTTSARAKATAYNLSGEDNVSDASGEYTPFGESVTLTITLTGAASSTTGTAAVVDGYAVTFAERRVCDTGNVTVTSTPVISSGGTAVYTVAAATDALPAVVGGAANLGNWCSSEVTITMAGTGTGQTALSGVYQPLGHTAAVSFAASTLTDGGYNTSWSDAAASWITASDALSVSANNALVSTTGSLMDATATAYDQYGRGFPGKTVKFTVDGADKIIATTGADGTATYTFVACTTNGIDAVATSTTGADMATIAATTPSATVEGTTVYCYTAAADGPYGDVTAVQEVQTIALAGTGLGGVFTLCYKAVCDATAAFNGNAAAINADFDGLSTLEAGAAVSAAPTLAANASSWVVTFNTNWGDAELITCANVGAALTVTGGAAATCTVTQGAQGAAANTSDFIDHDSGTNLIVAKRVTTGHNGTAASNVATSYIGYTYDGATDVMGGAAAGLTEAQFEASLTAVANLTTELKGTVRNGALTTGVSVFQIG